MRSQSVVEAILNSKGFFSEITGKAPTLEIGSLVYP